jgi:Asp-tRNA(Asn)/Glu-tRNA(Gln) amidotransferase A subunit family amidase
MNSALPVPVLAPFFSVSAQFASGKTTPRQFLEECLQRIEIFEPGVGAWVGLAREQARSAADAASARWKKGQALSSIDGMPIGVKDVIDTADMPTQMGSPLYDGYVPRFDAATVSAVRAAGAVILGKTVTTEFASTEPRGTRNPWDVKRTPGGSSSGSAAAVATGMVPAALGTQVVGSTLRPAGFCGCVGFKPTVGGINRGGSLDYLSQSCIGVLAASLDDAWLMAHEMARRVGGDPGFLPLTGPDLPPTAQRPKTLAVLETAGWDVVTDEGRGELERAVNALRNARIAIVTRHDNPVLDKLEIALREAEQVTREINAFEWRWPLNVFDERDAANVTPASRERLAFARGMSNDHYAALLARREEIRAIHASLASVVDAAVTLTAPGAAPIGLHNTGNPIFVLPGSLLGIPGIALPLLRAEGLPLGLQILGFPRQDAQLFGHAAGIQEVLMSGVR